MSSILVIDVGTSSLRASIVRPDGTIDAMHRRALPPDTPVPGLVEFDAAELAAAVIELAGAALGEGGPVAGVGITNQRASTVVWDRATGRPLGPAIGWQDLRTVIECLTGEGRARPRPRPQPVGDEGCVAARRLRPRSLRRHLHRHRRRLVDVGADRGRGARHRPHERGRHRADRRSVPAPGTSACASCSACHSPRCPRSSTAAA